MGSPLLAIFSVLPVLNAATLVIACCVILLCAFLSRAFSHIPDWMSIPPIMMTGYQVPESVIYSGGLTVVGIGLIFCQSLLFLLRRAMLHRDWKPDDKNLGLRFANVCEYSFSVVAALALIVQAVVPVQETILYTFYNYAEVDQNTITHENAAACWWLGQAVHWTLNAVVEGLSPQLSILRKYRSFSIKLFFIAVGLVTGILGLFLKPDLPAPKATVSFYFHATNLCYWISTVSFFLAYFVQSWQAAALLDHLGIRSFIFGSLATTKPFAAPGEPVSTMELPKNVEEGHSRSD